MMKKIFLLIMLLPMIAAGQGFKTTLKGRINGRPMALEGQKPEKSKAIAVFYGEDGFGGTPRYTLPIVDGKFEGEIEVDAMRMMTIYFLEDAEGGGGRYLEFFPDAEEVEIVFGKRGQAKGGELTKRIREFKREADKEARAQYAPTPELKKLSKQLRKLNKDGKGISDPEVKPVYDRFTQIRDSLDQIVVDAALYPVFYREDDLVAYALFLDRMYFQEYPTDPELLERVRAKFAAAHPGHPYNQIAADRVGGRLMTRFVDFTAPNLTGEMYTLSEQIEGKVALIDLWASWCGWCIVDSREVVPIYNEYKDKGFTVVGVMRERENLQAMAATLAREKFPWLNLVDLDDKLGIWNKYGIANAGGGTVLVDSKGNVVKKNPTAEEIREYLENNLK